MTGKRRRRKGLVAMGMSLVLAMSVAPPVWAATASTQGNLPDAGKSVSSDKLDNSHVHHNTYTDLEDSWQSTLTLANECEYTVSIPKQIRLTNNKSTTEQSIPEAVVIKSCDLAPRQQLDLYVTKEITLKDRIVSGDGTAATRKIDAYFKTDNSGSIINESDPFTLAKATPSNSYVVPESGSEIGGGEKKSATLFLKPQQDIYAGVWYGKVNFTIKSTAVSANPGEGTDASTTSAW